MPDEHFVGFLRNVSSIIGNEIAYLKTLTVVRQITTSSGDVPITNEIIVQAFRELNKEAGDFLGSFPKVKNYRTKNPNEVQHCHAYGEDPALHIMRTGQTIKAFDFSGERTRTMQEKFTRQVLRADFGCMDLGIDEEAKSLGPAHRKIRYDMQKDPFVVNTQSKLVDLAKRRNGLVISTNNQQRIVRLGSRAGSSRDVAPLACRAGFLEGEKKSDLS